MTHLDRPQDGPRLQTVRRTYSSSLIACENCRTKRSRVAVREEIKNIFANDDLAIEILSRLSAESINELKCVCKQWLELLSSPSFSIAHVQRSARSISGVFVQGLYYDSECSRNYLEQKEVDYIHIGKEGRHATSNKSLDFLPEEVVVTTSCNGILLCRNIFEAAFSNQTLDSMTRKTDAELKEVVLYVCNPFTKDWIVLKPKGRYRNGCCYGFTYNLLASSVSPTYEVVMVEPPFQLGKDPYIFNIYSSRIGAWKTVKEVCSLTDRLHVHQSCFANEVFYWLTTGHSILSFDLKHERSQVIKLPGHALQREEAEGICLGVSEGNLHYICLNMEGLMVWVLEYDNSIPKWSLKQSKPQHQMPHRFVESWERTGEQVPFYISDGKNCPNEFLTPYAFQDDILFLKVNWLLSTYNIKTGEFEEELCPFYELQSSQSGTPIVIPHCKSLLQVEDKKH